MAEAVGVVGAAAKWMKWPGYSFMLRQEAAEPQGLHQVSPLCVCGGDVFVDVPNYLPYCSICVGPQDCGSHFRCVPL